MIKWVDSVKGIGILLIMLVHMNAFPCYSDIVSAGYVSMFFVVSGYTFNPNRGFRKGIRRKTSRLLVPYFFYTIFFVVLTCLMSVAVGKDPEWLSHFAGVLYSRRSISVDQSDIMLSGGCTPLWFMTSLFTSYLFVYIWQYFNCRWIMTLLYALLAVAFSFLPILLPWSVDTAPVGALLIIAGYRFKPLFTYKKGIWLLLPTIVLFVLTAVINGQTNMSIRHYGMYPVVSILLFVILGFTEAWIFGTIFRHLKMATSVFAYLGRQSLRLMCIHMFVWVAVKDLVVVHIDKAYHIPAAWAVIALILLFNHVLNVFFPTLSSKYHI